MKKQILFITFALLISSVFAQQYKTVRNGSIKMQIPENWESKPLNENGFKLIAYEPVTSDDDIYIEYVTVFSQLLDETMKVSDYKDFCIQHAKETTESELKVIEEKKNYAVYSYVVKETYKINDLVYFFIYDKTAYVITCSTLEEEFSKYRPVFEQIVKKTKFSW